MTSRFLVSGIVQGVGFRWYVARHARGLGLTGFARNLPDGRVEAVFEGATEAVERMVAWAGQGPERARIDGLSVTDEPAEGLTAFRIR